VIFIDPAHLRPRSPGSRRPGPARAGSGVMASGRKTRFTRSPPCGQLLGRVDLGSGERDVHEDHLSSPYVPGGTPVHREPLTCSAAVLTVNGRAAGGLGAAAGPRSGEARQRQRVAVRVYGRVSTEDWQDPVTSQARQRAQADALVRSHGRVVPEFFDAGQSRTVAWARWPQAAALVAVLACAARILD